MSKRLAVTDSIAFAFGFAWQALDPVESKSSKLAELLGQGNKWQASYKKNGTEYLGVSKDNFSPLPKIKTLSGAAMMANHPELVGKTVWIVMEEPIDGDQGKGGASLDPLVAKSARSEMVVVGLVNGNIVIDDYVDTEGYHKQRAVFLDRCSKAKANHITVGTSYNLGRVAQQYKWSDFLPAKGKKSVPVRTLEPGVYGRVLLVALAVAVCFGIGWSYVAWSNAQKVKAERERRARESRNIPAMYKASVAAILDQPVMRANTAFAELRDRLRRFPVQMAGWKLSQIDCRASTSGCVATWANKSGLGTNRGFIDAAPKEWGTVTFNPDGQTLSHSLPFKLTVARLPARDVWPHERDFLVKQFSQWQSYWIVGFHPELDPVAHVAGLISGLDEQTAAELPDAIWTRRWTIKPTPWYLSDGFDRTAEKGDANLPDSVTVDQIGLKVDSENQVKFEAEGAIYESK